MTLTFKHDFDLQLRPRMKEPKRIEIRRYIKVEVLSFKMHMYVKCATSRTTSFE